MSRFPSRGILCLFLVILLGPITTVAAETPYSLAYVQGGNASVISDSDGSQKIVIESILPYFHFGYGEKGIMLPIDIIDDYPRPFNAVLVFFNDNQMNRTIVEVENLSLDNNSQILSLSVKPNEYYEGTVLKSFVNESKEVTPDQLNSVLITGMYLEIPRKTPNNGDCLYCKEACGDEGPGCGWCYDSLHHTMVPCGG